MSEEQIESLSIADFMALRARHIADLKRRDKELRYILVAITGNKNLLKEHSEHMGPGPRPETVKAPLDKSAMEFSRRLAAMGV